MLVSILRVPLLALRALRRRALLLAQDVLAGLSLAALALPAAAQGTPNLQWVAAGHESVATVTPVPGTQTLLTSSGSDNTLKLWNLDDGTFIRTLNDQFGQIHSHAVSPDGTQAVSGGEIIFGLPQSNVLQWDLATGQVIRELAGSQNVVFGVAWSPTGLRVAAGDQSGRIFQWNAATGAPLLTIPSPGGGFNQVFGVAYSPDGTRLAAAYSDGNARIFNAMTGALQNTLIGHTFFVQGVVFSPDGSKVATASWDQTARIWDASTGTSLHTLTGHTDLVFSVAFSPNGATLATGSWDHSIKLWTVATGALQQTITATGMDSVFDARFTLDGAALVSGSVEGHPRRFPIQPNPQPLVFGHHTSRIRAVDASGDGARLVSVSADNFGRVFDATTGADLLTLTGHFDVVNAVSVSADHLLIATGAGSPPPDTKDPSVRLWNGATGQLLFTLAGHTGGTTAVDLTPDKSIVASGGRDGLLKLWNTSTGALLNTVPGQTGGVRALAYSPDGQMLAVAASTKIRLFDADSLALIKTLTDVNVVSSLSWSPDGHSLASGLDAFGQNVRVWNVDAGTMAHTFAGDEFGFTESVAFNSDGQTVASGSGYTGQIRIWFVADESLLKMYDEETGTHGINPELPLVYTPDGRLAYGRTDPTVLMSQCDGTISTFGSGRAGSGGFVPALAVGGCASPGGTLQFSVSNALGGSTAFLLFGLGAGSAPFKGCTLLVTPVLPTVFTLPLSAGGPGAGSVAFPALVPPGTPDVTLALQAWIADPAGPAGFTATAGVLLQIE